MGFFAASPAGSSCTLPNAPKSTLVIERFIARHIRMDRMKPEEPSNDPVMIWILLSSMKPIAASVRPAYELSRAITTGMSAAPMGRMSSTPKMSASATTA